MSHNEQLAHYLRVARGQKALRYGKPVISCIDGEWWITSIHPANGDVLMVPEMFSAYVDRLNGIDTTERLAAVLEEICFVGRDLVQLGKGEEARKVLRQYRVRSVRDLPAEWRPAVLYDLKQLLKGHRS